VQFAELLSQAGGEVRFGWSEAAGAEEATGEARGRGTEIVGRLDDFTGHVDCG